RCDMAFKEAGDRIVLLGPLSDEGIGGSQFLETVHGLVAGTPPDIDLDLERRVQECCRKAIEQGLAKSAHDCSDGGLAVALAESCITGQIGAEIGDLREMAGAGSSIEGLLFGEGQSRIVVSVSQNDIDQLMSLAERAGIPAYEIGAAGGAELRVGPWIKAGLEAMSQSWEHSLEELMSAPQQASIS
ncbi:MAG: AIR synthase-related protein, partial [Chloroflexi bacterium]|nr:AIR synthase-related protein [Chloroflexota bacterium]